MKTRATVNSGMLPQSGQIYIIIFFHTAQKNLNIRTGNKTYAKTARKIKISELNGWF